jgi:hypothetical protein
MHKKSILWLFAILSILSALLSACQNSGDSKNTPAPRDENIAIKEMVASKKTVLAEAHRLLDAYEHCLQEAPERDCSELQTQITSLRP